MEFIYNGLIRFIFVLIHVVFRFSGSKKELFNSAHLIQVVTMPASIRKIVLTALLFITVVFRASSPSREAFVIFDSPPVEAYKNLIFAIGLVETMNDTLAYNPVEQATGIFQIRPIRLEDYNRRTGKNYKMKDLFNYKISEQIFLYYSDQIGPYDLEQIARRWNGSGHMTTYYWNRIKQYI